MSDNVRLWKFWLWESVFALALLALAVGALLYTRELDIGIGERRVEVGLASVIFIGVATALSYRLATGTLVGFGRWIMRLMGSGLAVAVGTLSPALLIRSLVKPEYFNFASPFLALFVLWGFYGFVFFIRWQTRLFYGLMRQVRQSE